MLDTKSKLSTLWIVVMLNMIFADIYSIMVLLGEGHAPDIPGDARLIMLAAVFITNIPLLMVYFSKTLNLTANRRANIGVAIFTIVYVIGGGDTAPHYIATAVIEIALLAFIICTAWKWQAPDALTHTPNA